MAESPVALADRPTTHPFQTRLVAAVSSVSRVRHDAIVLVSTGIQIAVGAYQGERGNYSDEAAHFMNGLLVHDYLTRGLGGNPMRFAEKYYLSYPKIAPFMWPPLFDGALGLFMLFGWPPQVSALILLDLITAWAAWRLYRIVRLFAAEAVAWLVALLFVCTPAVVNLTSAVMLDIVVAMFALEATYWLAVFFITGNSRHGALFGLFAACGCLTKGNGVAIVLVPPVLLMLTGRLDLLRRPGLYLAAAIVVVFAVPPLAYSYSLDASIGDFVEVGKDEAFRRLLFYARFIWQDLGSLASMLALIGLAQTIRWRRADRDAPMFVYGKALTALAIAAVLFHITNPHRTTEGRYIALAVAPLLGLVPIGVRKMQGLIRLPRWPRATEAVLYGAVILSFAGATPAMAQRQPLGYRDVVGFLQTHGGLEGLRMLVVSDENGEGAFVSEVAVRPTVPAATVIRGSKFIGSDDWEGRQFRMLYPSSAALLRNLEDLHVDYLVVDHSAAAAALPYWDQVVELVETNQDRLERTRVVVAGRTLVVYRLKYRSPGPAKKLELLVSSMRRLREQ
jgi:Dolichyl-phosphate-mannose-protein mannosyltransferase